MTNDISLNRLPFLDGWRGIAIACLLAGHFFPMKGMNLGALGVDLFFVLSGLLMGRILFLDEVPISTFYQRRIARIFPLAYLFVATVALCYLAWGLPFSLKDTLAAAGFVINYVRDGHATMPLGHFWSLCVEEHAYVALSLIAIGVRARRVGARRAIGAALCVSIAAGTWYCMSYRGPDLYHERWLRSEVSAFGIFVSAFLLLLAERWRPRAIHWSVIVLLLGLGLMAHWWRFAPPVRTFIGTTALAAAVNLLMCAPNPVRSLLAARPLRMLGIASFSIYIWQQPFYMAVEAGQLNPIAGVLGALLAGTVSFHAFENPARRWLNKKWRTPNRQAAAEVRHDHEPAAAERPDSRLTQYE